MVASENGDFEVLPETRSGRARARIKSDYERDRNDVDQWLEGSGGVALAAVTAALALAFLLAILGVHF